YRLAAWIVHVDRDHRGHHPHPVHRFVLLDGESRASLVLPIQAHRLDEPLLIRGGGEPICAPIVVISQGDAVQLGESLDRIAAHGGRWNPVRTESGASPSASSTQDRGATLATPPCTMRLPRSSSHQCAVSKTICQTTPVLGSGRWKS